MAAVHPARLAGQEVLPHTGVRPPDPRILLGHQALSAGSLLAQLQDLRSLGAASDLQVSASAVSSPDHSASDPLVSAELEQPAEEVGPCIAPVPLLAVVAMAALWSEVSALDLQTAADAGLAAVGEGQHVVAAAADVGLPEDADQEPVAVGVAAAVGDFAADVDLGFAAELDEDWAAVQGEDLAVGQDADSAAVEAVGVAAAGVD